MNQFVEVNQLKIFYRVFGNGHPVIFLHGFLEDSSIWDTVVKRMSEKEYKILLINLPGHGKSDCPENICTMAFMAKAVFKVMQICEIDQPLVFGHSMGGYVSLELAKLTTIFPVLVHSNFWCDSGLKQLDRDRVIEIVAQNKKLFIKQAIPNLFSKANLAKNSDNIIELIKKASAIPKGYIQAVTKGMRNRVDNTAFVKTINIGIIQGDKDPIIPFELMAEKVKKDGINANFQVISECGHMGFFEQEEAFYKAINYHCNKV